MEYETAAYLCFVGLTKGYDSVDRHALIAILKNYKVPCHLNDIIKEMYTDTWCQVRTAEGFLEEFRVESGVREGCVLSPLLILYTMFFVFCFFVCALSDSVETHCHRTYGSQLHSISLMILSFAVTLLQEII